MAQQQTRTHDQIKDESEIIITENFAATLERTSRGYFATVTDAGSPFNGIYALGSIPSHAIAALEGKIRRMKR
jgi:hypothetical protein